MPAHAYFCAMDYQTALDYLYHKLPMFQRIGSKAFKKDLSNTLKLLQGLNEPHHQFKSIHIAGTNGKGSSAHALAAVLQAAGYKTGLYTSPHLKDFTERIKIDGKPVSENYVAEFVTNHEELIAKISPSFFEITVAMAFDYFARGRVGIAVVETGLGGRLDSTNVLTPLVSLITNISYDHQALLGDTLPLIAGEKAGIIKPGVPVVVSERQPEVEAVFEKHAREKEAILHFASDTYEATIAENTLQIYRDGKEWLSHLQPQLSGAYQTKNYPGVFQVLSLLESMGFKVQEKDIVNGLTHLVDFTGLKGRWQKIGEQPLTICDVAHNESGVMGIVNQIEATPHDELHIVWGMVNDKETEKVLKLLPPQATYYFCAPDMPRALAVGQLAGTAHALGLKGESYGGVNEAISAARQAASHEALVYIGGSTFVVAAIDNL